MNLITQLLSTMESDGLVSSPMLAVAVIVFSVLTAIGAFWGLSHWKRRTAWDAQAWVLAEYKWEPGAFYPCRVRNVENEKLGLYTVYFYWGCLQPSTRHDQINWTARVQPPKSEDEPAATSSTEALSEDGHERNMEEPENNIWIAARRGDIETVKKLAKSMSDINALEPIGFQSNDGRSALYWSCLTGRTEIVELLLSMGAKDVDGSAFQAATCSDPVRARNDQRDLLFDPDLNIYSDNVVREAISRTDGSDDASRKIRALLTSARATGIIPAPSAVFDRPSTQCSVCFESFSTKPPAVCSPCGHSATCAPCLQKIRSSRSGGCPVCRSRIREIIPLVDTDNIPLDTQQHNGNSHTK